MAEIESRFNDAENATVPSDSGQILALVDAWHGGTLNDAQQNTLPALRASILALAEDSDGSRAQGVRQKESLTYCVSILLAIANLLSPLSFIN